MSYRQEPAYVRRHPHSNEWRKIAYRAAPITAEAVESALKLRPACTTAVEALVLWRIGAKLTKLEAIWKTALDTRARPKSIACET